MGLEQDTCTAVESVQGFRPNFVKHLRSNPSWAEPKVLKVNQATVGFKI